MSLPLREDEPQDPIPARHLNELVYCPRLFYLEHVAREWEDSADTIEGARVHRRVDVDTPDPLPAGDELSEERSRARSVTVSSTEDGLIAKTDVIEVEGGAVTPVDYKRGRQPDPERVPHGVWPADRVQMGAQILALRASGYRCDSGVVYYAASKARVAVAFDDQLASDVRDAVRQARAVQRLRIAPPPLVASPKCPRCSLVGICLPDETRFLADHAKPDGDPDESIDQHNQSPSPRFVRRLVPSRDDRLPLYVQNHGATIGVEKDCLRVRLRDGTATTVRIREISHVAIFGSVQVTAAAVSALSARGIGISHFTFGGWHYAMTSCFAEQNVLLRIAQFEAASDRERSIGIAREMIAGKILNSRTLLRRNCSTPDRNRHQRLTELARAARRADTAETLLGLEGTAARIYFDAFPAMLSARCELRSPYDFAGRNRRPPRDPINALLSLAYAMLVKDARIALAAVGFDPTVGLFHQPRAGRPALALDLMEEFRPLIADSVVLTALNTEVVTPSSFVEAAGAFALTEQGRRSFLAVYERRMEQEITHPIFRYTMSYRRILEVQARLLARVISGEIDRYPAFRTR